MPPGHQRVTNSLADAVERQCCPRTSPARRRTPGRRRAPKEARVGGWSRAPTGFREGGRRRARPRPRRATRRTRAPPRAARAARPPAAPPRGRFREGSRTGLAAAASALQQRRLPEAGGRGCPELPPNSQLAAREAFAQVFPQRGDERAEPLPVLAAEHLPRAWDRVAWRSRAISLADLAADHRLEERGRCADGRQASHLEAQRTVESSRAPRGGGSLSAPARGTRSRRASRVSHEESPRPRRWKTHTRPERACSTYRDCTELARRLH